MGSIFSFIVMGLLTTANTASVIPRAEPLDYGSCTNPTINWSKDKGFYPDNLKDFAHGAAEDITAIANFICSELKNKCKCSQDTFEACFGANLESGLKFAGKRGQAQADVFNTYLLTRKAPEPSSTTVPDVPTPTASNEASVGIVFSKEYVDFEGHIDPRWWFDNKIISSGERPHQCDVDGYQMPDDFWMDYDCDTANWEAMKLVRAALNGVVDATIDNTTASDDERIFKHGIATKTHCNRVSCWQEERKYTRFPKEVKVAIVGSADGEDFMKGDLHYWITKSTSFSCKVCSFFGASGTAGAAVAGARHAVMDTASKLANPAIAFTGAVVTIGCMAACG